MSTHAKLTKYTTSRIRALKGKHKIVSLTAYDSSTAKLVDEAGIHLIIVGDSLGMTVLGYDSTIPVTMEDMMHHIRAVARGAPHALVVGVPARQVGWACTCGVTLPKATGTVTCPDCRAAYLVDGAGCGPARGLD